MARVSLIFEDGDEPGEVNVKVDFGEGVKPDDIMTLAQNWALKAVEWVSKQGKASLEDSDE